MRGRCRRLFAGRGQLGAGVAADRREEPIPHVGTGSLRNEEGPVDQPAQQVRDVGIAYLTVRFRVPAGDRPGGIEVETPRKYAQSPEDHPFRFGEQVVAPVQSRPQALLTLRRATDPVGTHETDIVHPGSDLRHRQQPHARRGQFDRQRQPAGHPAQLRRGRSIRIGQFEGRACRTGAQLEQLPGRAGADLQGCSGAAGRNLQRLDRPERLAVHRQRFPAGGQDPQPGTRLQQIVDQSGGRLHDVLAIVEAQQHALGADRGDDRLRDGQFRHLGHAQTGPDRIGDQPCVGHDGQVDPRHTVRCQTRRRITAGDGGREPGLADTTGPGQRHQPRAAQCRDDASRLAVTADQRCAWARQSSPRRFRQCPARHTTTDPASRATGRPQPVHCSRLPKAYSPDVSPDILTISPAGPASVAGMRTTVTGEHGRTTR